MDSKTKVTILFLLAMLLLISVEVTAIAGGVANIDDRVFPSFSGSPIGSGGSSNNFPRGGGNDNNNFPHGSGINFPNHGGNNNFPRGSDGDGVNFPNRGGNNNFPRSGGVNVNFPNGGNNFPRDDSDSNNNLSGVGFPGIIDSRNFPLGTGSFSNGHGFSRGGSDNFFSSGGDNFPRNGGGNFFDGGIGNGFSRGGGVFGGGLPGQ